MKSRITFCILSCFFFAAFSSLNQKERSSWLGEIVSEEGVAVIKNPKEPIHREGFLFLEEDLTIQWNEINRGKRPHRKALALEVDDGGNIFVLDKTARNVTILDSSGLVVCTFLIPNPRSLKVSKPASICLSPQNEIIIQEMARRALLFFSVEGKYLRKISIVNKHLFSDPEVFSQDRWIASHTVPTETPYTELSVFDAELNR